MDPYVYAEVGKLKVRERSELATTIHY